MTKLCRSMALMVENKDPLMYLYSVFGIKYNTGNVRIM